VVASPRGGLHNPPVVCSPLLPLLMLT
jgi:hypothetical protein